MAQPSVVKCVIPSNKIRGYTMDRKTTNVTLDKLGIHYDKAALNRMMKQYKRTGMDALTSSITTPSITTPIQFLQTFLAEPIYTVTAARNIDNLVNRTIVGSFEDEEIVARVVEKIGSARPMTDYGAANNSDWNLNFETRTIVRYEDGFECSILEEMRAGRVQMNSAQMKRDAVAESLAITMNEIGFYGYNDGENRTYGFLNDPNQSPYKTVATGSSGETTWDKKTFFEIQADIRTAISTLREQTKNLFNPMKDPFVLAISLDKVDYLGVTSTYTLDSVKDWLTKTYPACRIETAPELTGANGGLDVFYLYLEKLGNQTVVEHNIVDTFRLLGTEKRVKSFVEDYANATAGVLWRHPVAMLRYTGI